MRLWYVAARKQDWGNQVRHALQVAGEQVWARWLDTAVFGQSNTSEEERAQGAAACAEDCKLATDVVLFAEPDSRKTKGGRHFECGIVYGRGGSVHVIGPKEHILHWLPDVTVHATIEDFIHHIRRRDL